MRNVRLKDVAEAAGVSISTASRALSGSPRIRPETIARVREAAQQLGYKPNVPARSLSVGLTHNVGMVVANPVGLYLRSDHFFLSVVEGATRVLGREGYGLIVSITKGTYRDRADLPQMILNSRVDGVIVGGIPMEDSFVRAVARCGLPVVFIGRYLETTHLNMVAPNNLEGGRLGAEHLLRLGHRSLAVISGPLQINTFRDRYHGVEKAVQEAGVQAQVVLVEAHAFDEAAGYAAMRRLLKEPSVLPTAIFGLTDWQALGVMRALCEEGLAIPTDVSVVGFSDTALAAVSDPPLTTVKVSSESAGALAARLVLGLLAGEVEGPVNTILPACVVDRASCGPPRER